MPGDKALVPLNGGAVSADAAANISWDEVLENMINLLNSALASLVSINYQNADMAALRARALYEESKQYASNDDNNLQILKLYKDIICLYSPLVRLLAFQTEGDFDGALDALEQGLTISSDANVTIEKYVLLPNADKEIIELFQPVYSIFPILFRGFGAYIRADVVGYQGNIPEYLKLLQKAVEEYRKATDLPPRRNPTFVALSSLCTGSADRLQKRIKNFKSKPAQLYAPPTGDKIFIIHGHDEAKWRDLRDLLEDEFKLKTVVLKDEPGGGRTLIQKLEESAIDCRYAFALLTPDDIVKKDGKSYLQARPNVLFELGWFYGHFGRERVCIVKKATTEVPSDVAGIVTINFNNAISEGFIDIQKELRKVGVIN